MKNGQIEKESIRTEESHCHGQAFFVHDHTPNEHENVTHSPGKAFIWGIVLNIGFVLVEFSFGHLYGSVALLSDAGHNLGDVASLVLALLAFRFAKKKTSKRFTYGYQKSTILASLINAFILLVTVGFILKDALMSILTSRAVDGEIVFIVALVGIVINGLTACLFLKDKDKDVNVRGAFLHMLADTIVSLGVVVSGLLLFWTGWRFIDPIIGIVIALVILISTWTLLTESLRLTLDAVPDKIDLDKISQCIESCPGVQSMHHLHIWALSTTETALTVHIVLDKIPDMEQQDRIKHEIQTRLLREGISHITLELESSTSVCFDPKHRSNNRE